MKTSELLDLAADFLEGNEWLQGAGWGVERDGGLCLEGAIIAALELDEDSESYRYATTPFHNCPAYVAVADYLQLSGENLWHWNDRDGRTKEEVVAVLRAASAVQSAREAEHVEEPVTV